MSDDPRLALAEDLEAIAADLPQESGGFAELRRLLGILPNPMSPLIPGSQAQLLEDPDAGAMGLAAPVSGIMSGAGPGTQPGWDQAIASQGVVDAFTNTGIGSTGGFGSAVRRYLTSGVYNGDFALPPRITADVIGAANPLPFWTWTALSGVNISAKSVADAASGSGRILQFEMTGAGAAADDAYVEQIVPVNASRSQAYAYRVRCAFLTDATVSGATWYLTVQYLKADAVTVTGAAGTTSATTASIGATTIFDRSVVANGGGQVPADAQYIRIRVGFQRAAAAVTVAELLSVLELHLITGPSEVLVQDVFAPANNPTRMIFQNNIFTVGPGITPLGAVAAPVIQMVNDGSSADKNIVITASATRLGGRVHLTGSIDSAVDADQNNFSPAGLATTSVLKFTGFTANRTLTGLDASVAQLGLMLLINDTAFSLLLLHESALSTAANRFKGAGAATVTVRQRGSVLLHYNASVARWFILAV